MPGWTRDGGTQSARGSRRRTGFPPGSPRCSTGSGTAGWCPVCGLNPRSSACTARWPPSFPPTRSSAAVKHLDEVVDFLAGDLGVGYLKLDYNILVGPGPDTNGGSGGPVSPGAGLLAANRAHLDWLDAALDRHPGLVIENCASGAMRADYALLARLQLQSTSDQEDYLRCPPIAAAAPASIAPEQAAVWAYPQPDFTDDEIAFAMASAMLGRIHLSGYLNRMNPRQRALVADA